MFEKHELLARFDDITRELQSLPSYSLCIRKEVKPKSLSFRNRKFSSCKQRCAVTKTKALPIN